MSRKKFLAMILAVTMIFTLAIPAMMVSAAECDCDCDCEIVFRRVIGQNTIFLGFSEPAFVVFSDGQMPNNHVAIWSPNGDVDLAAVNAAVAGQDIPGWWDRVATYSMFSDSITYGNHDFWVEEIDGRWFASKTNGTISNTIWFGDFCDCECICIGEPIGRNSDCRTVVQQWLNDGYNVIINTAGSGGFGISANHPMGDFVIPAGVILTVDTLLNVRAEAVVIVEGTLVINGRLNSDETGSRATGGTIIVAEGGQIINNGTVNIAGRDVENRGGGTSELHNNGTIVNNGAFNVREFVVYYAFGPVEGSLNVSSRAIVITP